MAKAKVVHSTHGCSIIFKGDPKTPEPALGSIEFPGGRVEVSRTSDQQYWVHVSIAPEKSFITDSRIDYTPEAYAKYGDIPDIPAHEEIAHLAVKMKKI